MLDLINQERAERGLATLEFDPELAQVAEEHARDMIERDYFAHENPDGQSPADRARSHDVSFRILGENLAGNTDVADAHRMLMESDGHRANILENRYGRVGISIVDGGRYGKMMVQKFADGSPANPVDFGEDEAVAGEQGSTESGEQAAARQPSVTIDGEPLELEGPQPRLVNGRTLVPLRGVFEAMGAEIQWDGETRTVAARRDGVEVQLTIGEPEMLVDGRKVTLDEPGRIDDGRTLIPLRAVSEALGVRVDWDGDTRTVVVESAR